MKKIVLILLLFISNVSIVYAVNMEYVPLRYPPEYSGCNFYDIQKRVVEVNGNGNKSGSGIIVSSEYIVTSLHLDVYELESTEFIVKSDITGKEHKAHFVDTNYVDDITILKFDKPIDIEFEEPFKLADPITGNKVYIMGYSNSYPNKTGSKPLCFPGRVTGEYTLPFWHSTAFALKGLSGGPVFDITDGETVGLNRALIPKIEYIKGNKYYVSDLDGKHSSPVAISNMLTQYKIPHIFNGVKVILQ